MHVGNVANAKTRKNSALQIKFEKDLLRKYSTCLSVSLSLCVYRSNLISKEIKTSDIKKVEKPSRRWCCGALCFVLFLLFLYCFFCVYVSRRMRLVCRERWRRIKSQSNDSNCDKLLYLLSNVYIEQSLCLAKLYGFHYHFECASCGFREWNKFTSI